PSWYASPPDVWGRSAVVLDYGGQPYFYYAGQSVNPGSGPAGWAGGYPTGYNPGETVDTPYELCLNGAENGTDSPYTAAELELLYRYHDPDATQLPRRLMEYAGGVLASESPGVVGQTLMPGVAHCSQTVRNMLTTHSSSIPTPMTTIPQEMRAMAALNVPPWD